MQIIRKVIGYVAMLSFYGFLIYTVYSLSVYRFSHTYMSETELFLHIPDAFQNRR